MIRNVLYCMVVSALLLLAYAVYDRSSETVQLVMGSRLYMQSQTAEEDTVHTEMEYDEKYFRPSKLPILNNRQFGTNLLWDYHDKDPAKVAVPEKYLKTAEDTLLNYFSLLKHAENLKKDQSGGCGTVGESKLPYPLAYGFLSKEYKARLPYDSYLDSFAGIGHLNLIKLRSVPKDSSKPEYMRYFVELETIEGSSKGVTKFAYYYGFVFIMREGTDYKIADMQLWGEDFLCAPYHGWSHDAEASVAIRYGGWCKLIKERYPTKLEGYVKDVDFSGTDGKDYRIRFFKLTNGTDVEISQYRKGQNGQWELIALDPKKCLEKKQ